MQFYFDNIVSFVQPLIVKMNIYPRWILTKIKNERQMQNIMENSHSWSRAIRGCIRPKVVCRFFGIVYIWSFEPWSKLGFLVRFVFSKSLLSYKLGDGRSFGTISFGFLIQIKTHFYLWLFMNQNYKYYYKEGRTNEHRMYKDRIKKRLFKNKYFLFLKLSMIWKKMLRNENAWVRTWWKFGSTL